MDPVAKRARLEAFRQRIPFVSQRALAAILTEAKKRPLPTVTKRDNIRQARKDIFERPTPYGPLLHKVELERLDGSIETIKCINPFSFLFLALSTCKYFASLVCGVINRSGVGVASPWSLIGYADEVSPGNQLKSKNKRKMWAVYFSFLDFLPEVLCHEDSWITMATVRSITLENVKGGVSALYGALLKVWFNPAGFNIQTAGFLVPHLAGNCAVCPGTRIWASLEALLADEGALHAIWKHMGASGTKLCCECFNVFALKWWRQHVSDRASRLLPHTCSDPSRFEPHDQTTIETVHQQLQEKKQSGLPKTKFKEFESFVGWRHAPQSILQDPALRSVVRIDQNYFDWVHCFVVNGIANRQIHLTVLAMKSHGLTYQHMYEFALAWNWPRRMEGAAATGVDALEDKRAKSSWKAGAFHASASELLSLMPILSLWVEKVMTTVIELAPVAKAFLLLAHIIELCQLAARPGVVAADALQDAIVAWCSAFSDAFGEDDLPPKTHFVYHIVRWLRKYGFLLNTLVHERKHKTIKAHGDTMDNSGDGFDEHVLEEVTAHAFYRLAECEALALPLGLINPTAPPKGQLEFLRQTWPAARALYVATTCRFDRRGVCSVGDVVTFKGVGSSSSAGRIWFIAEIDNELLVCGLYLWTSVQRFMNYSTWRNGGEWGLLEAKDIEEVCIWSGDDELYTIINYLTMDGDMD